MLFLCQIGCKKFGTTSIHITHIHFTDTNQLSRIRHHCKHTCNRFFQAAERATVFVVRDMHLCADTIDLCDTITLPFLNPIDDRPDFFTSTNTIFGHDIPGSLKIVIVDEKFDILWTIFASQTTCLAYVVKITHVILPVEVGTTNIPRATITLRRSLQSVVAFTIIATTTDGLVYKIPSLNLTIAGFHHTLDPLIHGLNKGVMALLLSTRNHLTLITLKLDALDIDVTSEVNGINLQEQEIGAIHGRLDVFYNNILPV